MRERRILLRRKSRSEARVSFANCGRSEERLLRRAFVSPFGGTRESRAEKEVYSALGACTRRKRPREKGKPNKKSRRATPGSLAFLRLRRADARFAVRARDVVAGIKRGLKVKYLRLPA